jgi:hypothetical protein
MPSDRYKYSGTDRPQAAEDEAGIHPSGTFRRAAPATPQAHSSRQLTILSDALDVVLRDLSDVAEVGEKALLYSRAEELAQRLASWSTAPPTGEERSSLMHEVLTLHMAVARLRRDLSEG